MIEKEKRVPLVEMFGPTIQGEGAVIGLQTYFLRFGLCDYKCKMCDSMNAVDPVQVKNNATWYTQDGLLEAFRHFYKPNTTRWVTLSGGNPCIHDLTRLVTSFQEHHFRTAVETQGTLCPDWLEQCDIITISPKGPGMGEDTNLAILDQFMKKCQWRYARVDISIKIVVFDQRDLEFAKMLYERYHTQIPQFFLSLGNPHPPGSENTPDLTQYVMSQIGRYKMLYEDIQNDRILSEFRFLPQWHTFLWGNDKGR